MRKCTGNNTQEWGFDAVFDARCHNCGTPVEFFKDEITNECMPGAMTIQCFAHLDQDVSAALPYLNAALDDLDMIIVVTAYPLYLVHNDQSWKHEKANIKLVGKFINFLPKER